MQTNEDLDYYKIPYVSNSSLSYFNVEEGGSPKKFKMYLDGTYEDKKSLSLDRGNLLHAYIENPSQFIISSLEKPTKMMCDWVEYIYNYYEGSTDPHLIIAAKEVIGAYINIKDDGKILKKFNDEGYQYLEFLKEADGKIIMTSNDKFIITNCISSLYVHERANQLLFTEQGLHEFTILNENDENCPKKCKLDKLIINHEEKQIIIVDLKTTNKSAYKFKDSWDYWHYYRQAAFYYNEVQYQYPDYNIKVFFVVASTTEYNVCVYEIHPDEILRGKTEINRLIQDIKWHKENDIWNMTREEYKNEGILTLNTLIQ